MFRTAKVLLADEDRLAPGRMDAAGRAPFHGLREGRRVSTPRAASGGRRAPPRIGARLPRPLQFDEPASRQHEDNEK